MKRYLLPLAAAAASALLPDPALARRCDQSCLLGIADKTVAAIAAKNFRSLPWADPVRYAENNVPLMIGDGWWGSAGATVGRKTFAIADPDNGNVVWFGTIWDHDAPAFGAIRIAAPEGRITELEVIAARTPLPIPFGDPRTFAFPPGFTAPVAPANRRSRERLVDIADAYLATKQRNDGTLIAGFAPDCTMVENGVKTSSADADIAPAQQDCASVFRAGLFAPVERIRDRRFPVVDPARGLVVAISVQDLPAREEKFATRSGQQVALKRPYPMSRLVAELVRIDGDEVKGAQGVVSSLPYRMPTPWTSGQLR